METVKLFVVEDHKIVRDGLRAMLLGVKNISIEREFSSGKEFLKFVTQESPSGTVILDIGLPDISGIEIAQTIVKGQSGLKIVMLTANIDEQSISKAIKLGITNYLAKDCSKDEFIDAVYAANENKEFFSKSVSQVLHSQYIHSIQKDVAKNNKLSDRELEVIRYIAEGLSYKEIGNKLCISARTVETHRYNILEKLSLKTNIDIVKYAIKSGIVSL